MVRKSLMAAQSVQWGEDQEAVGTFSRVSRPSFSISMTFRSAFRVKTYRAFRVILNLFSVTRLPEDNGGTPNGTSADRTRGRASGRCSGRRWQQRRGSRGTVA